jgi:hypothetical protein
MQKATGKGKQPAKTGRPVSGQAGEEVDRWIRGSSSRPMPSYRARVGPRPRGFRSAAGLPRCRRSALPAATRRRSPLSLATPPWLPVSAFRCRFAWSRLAFRGGIAGLPGGPRGAARWSSACRSNPPACRPAPSLPRMLWQCGRSGARSAFGSPVSVRVSSLAAGLSPRRFARLSSGRRRSLSLRLAVLPAAVHGLVARRIRGGLRGITGGVRGFVGAVRTLSIHPSRSWMSRPSVLWGGPRARRLRRERMVAAELSSVSQCARARTRLHAHRRSTMPTPPHRAPTAHASPTVAPCVSHSAAAKPRPASVPTTPNRITYRIGVCIARQGSGSGGQDTVVWTAVNDRRS